MSEQVRKRCYFCGKLFESTSQGIEPCSKCMEFPVINAIERLNAMSGNTDWKPIEGKSMTDKPADSSID